MKVVRENFVPVALGFLNGGGGNSLGAQTPSGKALSGELREALKKWKDLPEEERRKVVAPNVNPPRLPPGGLAIRVYMRPLKGFPGGEPQRISEEEIRKNPKDYPTWVIDPSEKRFSARLYAEPMGDILWLTGEEAQSLVPQDPQAGAAFAVPAPVARRIIRMHLKNGTQGWLGYWPQDHVRSGTMTLNVEKVAPVLRMRLEGSAVIADQADVSQSKLGYQPQISGVLEYDPSKKAFTRFDLLALGDSWGPPGAYSRPGRNPLGIAFELCRGDHPMDQAYPFALYFPGKDAYFRAETAK